MYRRYLVNTRAFIKSVKFRNVYSYLRSNALEINEDTLRLNRRIAAAVQLGNSGESSRPTDRSRLECGPGHFVFAQIHSHASTYFYIYPSYCSICFGVSAMTLFALDFHLSRPMIRSGNGQCHLIFKIMCSIWGSVLLHTHCSAQFCNQFDRKRWATKLNPICIG